MLFVIDEAQVGVVTIQDMIVLDSYVGLKFSNDTISFLIRPKVKGYDLTLSSTGFLDLMDNERMFWEFYK